MTITHGLANAFKKIFPKLQDHLLGRLIGHEFDADMHEEFTDSDRNSICFVGSKIYSVQTCHIYYTSYDLQWQCDTVNPHTHPDIMLHSPINEEGAEPTGMQEYLASIMPTFGLRIWWFLVPEKSGVWIFFGSVGLARYLTIVQDFVEHVYPRLAS